MLSTRCLQQFVNYSSDFPTVALVPTVVFCPWVWTLGSHDSLYLPVCPSNLGGSGLPLSPPPLSYGSKKSWQLSVFSVWLVRMESGDFQAHCMRTRKLEVLICVRFRLSFLDGPFDFRIQWISQTEKLKSLGLSSLPLVFSLESDPDSQIL